MKTFINKYQNLWYALAIFFYIDLIILTSVFVGKEVVLDYQIKQEAKAILDTPDLL